MGSIRTWGCLLTFAALAATPVADAVPVDLPAAHDPTTFHGPGIIPLEDCPQCRDAGLLAKPAAPAVRSRRTSSAGARSRATSPRRGPRVVPIVPGGTLSVDEEFRTAQVPTIPETPRPRVRTAPAPAAEESTPVPVPAPQPSPAPGPRARILTPGSPSTPTPPPTSPSTPAPPSTSTPPSTPSSIAAALAPPASGEDPFARAPATSLASEGGGSGASEVGFNYAPVMLGDQAPLSLRAVLATATPPVPQPPVPGRPPIPPSPFGAGGGGGNSRRTQTTVFVPSARGFKISDNQSPMPQDRVFYTFDYFNNINGEVNRRLGLNFAEMNVYRQMLGIEKTFLGGDASLGLRLPIDTLWTSSTDPTLRGNSTAVGRMTVFSKLVLWRNPTGNLFSGGLALTMPNGPSSFAGSPNAPGFRDVQIQPFVGYILRRDRFYVQGFSAIDISTDSNDVTMWYNDVALGYFAYRSPDPSAFLTAIIPTFEVHLNDPLNHRGAFRFNDPAATPDVHDLTLGTSFLIRRRILASFCAITPVTGPRPFDIEAMAILNVYYGRSGPSQATSPPILGQ